MPCGVGGGTHGSWPGGRGGRLRALVAGEGWVGFGAWLAVSKRGKSREGLACLAVPQEGAKARGGFGSGRLGVLFFESWRVDLVCLVLFGGQGRVGLAGQGLGGGPRASVPGGR